MPKPFDHLVVRRTLGGTAEDGGGEGMEEEGGSGRQEGVAGG